MQLISIVPQHASPSARRVPEQLGNVQTWIPEGDLSTIARVLISKNSEVHFACYFHVMFINNSLQILVIHDSNPIALCFSKSRFLMSPMQFRRIEYDTNQYWNSPIINSPPDAPFKSTSSRSLGNFSITNQFAR